MKIASARNTIELDVDRTKGAVLRDLRGCTQQKENRVSNIEHILENCQGAIMENKKIKQNRGSDIKLLEKFMR
jgi:hypothetical protein